MKLITTIFLLLISTLGLSQTFNTDSIKSDIVEEFSTHLESIGIDSPLNIECVSDAADFHARYMAINKIAGHTQSLNDIGDTIIVDFTDRGYFYCDTSYNTTAEIAGFDFFKDSNDFLINGPNRILNNFLESPDHKLILEEYHTYYGIGLSITVNDETGEITAYYVINYGEKVKLGNSRYPADFSINKDAESKYRGQFDVDRIIIR